MLFAAGFRKVATSQLCAGVPLWRAHRFRRYRHSPALNAHALPPCPPPPVPAPRTCGAGWGSRPRRRARWPSSCWTCSSASRRCWGCLGRLQAGLCSGAHHVANAGGRRACAATSEALLDCTRTSAPRSSLLGTPAQMQHFPALPQVTAELHKLEAQRASSAEGNAPLRAELRRLEAQVCDNTLEDCWAPGQASSEPVGVSTAVKLTRRHTPPFAGCRGCQARGRQASAAGHHRAGAGQPAGGCWPVWRACMWRAQAARQPGCGASCAACACLLYACPLRPSRQQPRCCSKRNPPLPCPAGAHC